MTDPVPRLEAAAEVAPGVIRIPLPFPRVPGTRLRHVNVHLVRRGSAWVLIDSGMGTTDSFDTLVAGVRSVGVEPEQVGTLLTTHSHPDHYGCSQRWRELSGARVLLSRREVQFIYHQLLLTPTDFQLFRERHGVPAREPSDESRRRLRDVFQPAAPDRTLGDDETLPVGDASAVTAEQAQVRSLLTAGHTPGHVVAHLADLEVLISGDHLLPRITPHIGLGPDGRGGEAEGDPLGDYIASLAAVRALPVRLVCPSHGPVFGNADHRIQQIIEHHEYRMRVALDSLARRPRTAWEVCRAIFGDLEVHSHDAGLAETLAHLRHLEVRGRVTRAGDDQPVRWALA